MQVRRERVVRRTKVIPLWSGVDVVADTFGVSQHDGGETGLHVPEDVAVEEPGTGLVSPEAKSSTSGTDTDDLGGGVG